MMVKKRSKKAVGTGVRQKKLTPVLQARKWWGERANAGRYVVSPAESPSPAVTKILRQEGFVMEVGGRRCWILVPSPPTDRRAVFLPNYWFVVTTILTRYAPAAVVGLQGVKLHLGDFTPPTTLTIHHSANQSEYSRSLEPGFSISLRPHRIPVDRLERIEGPGKASIHVLSPADLLATLDEPAILGGVEQVSAWLRHLVIRRPDLDRAVDLWPRPQVFQRLADMSTSLGNKTLAKQLDDAARRMSQRTASPARTGVGTKIIIPPVVAGQPRGSGLPWLDEQLMRLERQRAEVSETLGSHLKSLPKFSSKVLTASAIESKAYDAYHSTTMEGYKISPDVVDAIVRGESLLDGPQDEATLRSAMAVQGYSIAFDRVLALARKGVQIDGSLMLDLHEDLFRPSVDAGIVAPGDLRGWRTSSVGLTGWRHVPPNHRKVRDLIDGLERFASDVTLDPVTRAIIVHLEFVTIHPFVDGNGRLGRLLMNLVLLSGGLPWVTVRSDERIPFFKAIERAQVDGKTDHLIQYLSNLIQQSVRDIDQAA